MYVYLLRSRNTSLKFFFFWFIYLKGLPPPVAFALLIREHFVLESSLLLLWSCGPGEDRPIFRTVSSS